MTNRPCICDNEGTCLTCLIRKKIAENPGEDINELILHHYGTVGLQYYTEHMEIFAPDGLTITNNSSRIIIKGGMDNMSNEDKLNLALNKLFFLQNSYNFDQINEIVGILESLEV